MAELHDLSAVELLQRYRAKSVSPSEVFADVEKHIARWEPHLKALYAYDPESARAEAAASTARWAKGAPTGFSIPVREVRLSAGAEFVVAICGEIMTMPGLPKVPSADSIDVKDGKIVGLF